MRIQRRTVKRQITEDEANRLKTEKPFKTFRQDAKALNFGAIFGVSYKRFSAGALETTWNIERVNAFIKERGLESAVEDMAVKHSKDEPKLWKYYSVAEFMLKQFFDTYKGLQDRIKRNEELAKKVGYIRSHHGAIRRLPMLLLSTNEDGKTRYDDDRKEISGLINIASNTSIQSDEVATIMDCVDQWINNNDLSQYGLIQGTVHDSIDLVVDKNKAMEVLLKVKEIFERNDDWQLGLKFPIDLTIVDIEKGEYYKEGIDLDTFLQQQQQGATVG
jgi:DNA polymerase I-like protein with 3'-5' exonuclease and polymerase domains